MVRISYRAQAVQCAHQEMNIESKIVANERCGTVLFVRNLCENELRTLSQKTMCLERKYRVRQLSFHDFVSLYLRQTL